MPYMDKIETEIIPTRIRILHAARRCFSEKGFHSTPMKTICHESGVSPGTLYHYFPSKETLIESIILEDQERAIAHFCTPLHEHSLVDYLVTSMIEVTREDYAQRGLVVEIMAEGIRNPLVGEMLRNKYRTIISYIVERFEDAQKTGEIGGTIDKEMAARLLMAVTYGLLADNTSTDFVQEEGFVTSFSSLLRGLLQVQ